MSVQDEINEFNAKRNSQTNVNVNSAMGNLANALQMLADETADEKLVKIYNTVAEMQEDSENLSLNNVTETLGYATKGDGNGRKYIVKATDDGTNLPCGTGLWFNKFSNEYLEKGGYQGTAQDLKNDIDNISFPQIDDKDVKFFNEYDESLEPILIEQMIKNYGGRGQLQAEIKYLNSETGITAIANVGSETIKCDTTNFLVGSLVCIQHKNGLYKNYLVKAKTSDTLTISPKLQYYVDETSRIEKTWFDEAHIGKFGSRLLAQDIFQSLNKDVILPKTLVYQSNIPEGFGALPSEYEAVNGSSCGTAINSTAPLGLEFEGEHAFGGSIYIECTTINQGLKTKNTTLVTTAKTNYTVKLYTFARSGEYSIQIEDSTGFVLAEETVKDYKTCKERTFEITPQVGTNINIRILNKTNGANLIKLSSVRVYRGTISEEIGAIARKNETIVCLGDSWVAGNMSATLEREPFPLMLQKLMPASRIVNKGVGGNTVLDLLARFDTDVTPENPTIVIIHTGTNDAYNPQSADWPTAVTAFKNSMQTLIDKCYAIGAKPVIIGCPPQTQYYDEARSNWLLNDRARDYNKALLTLKSKGEIWNTVKPFTFTMPNCTLVNASNYVIKNGICKVNLDVTATANTGTGNFILPLPVKCLEAFVIPNFIFPSLVSSTPVNGKAYNKQVVITDSLGSYVFQYENLGTSKNLIASLSYVCK